MMCAYIFGRKDNKIINAQCGPLLFGHCIAWLIVRALTKIFTRFGLDSYCLTQIGIHDPNLNNGLDSTSRMK